MATIGKSGLFVKEIFRRTLFKLMFFFFAPSATICSAIVIRTPKFKCLSFNQPGHCIMSIFSTRALTACPNGTPGSPSSCHPNRLYYQRSQATPPSAGGLLSFLSFETNSFIVGLPRAAEAPAPRNKITGELAMIWFIAIVGLIVLWPDA